MATAKKTTTKSSTTRKSTSASSRQKAAPRSKTTPSKAKDSAVDQIEDNALKLVDEVASLLRKGIREGASRTEKTREATHKKALSLITRASNQLNKAVDTGTSVARKAVNKLNS